MKDLQVLSPFNNVLIPRIENGTRVAEGLTNLVQRVVKCLLAKSGSDIFNPEFGIGIHELLPKYYDETELDKTKTIVNQAIISLEKMIKEDDATVASLQLDERLSTLNLRSLSFDAAESSWVIDLSLETFGGTTVNFGVKA